MHSIWFITPAHGRFDLARVCLRQLRRTCDSLIENGIEAAAVVIADDENLDTARELGFGTVRRNNEFLGRKYNDGFQFACDRRYNPRPADFAMPYGTDDWIDYRILLEPPPRNTIIAFNTLTLVRPDRRVMRAHVIDRNAGPGLRMYPRSILSKAGYRPADEDRKKGCDTSTLVNLKQVARFNVEYRPIDARQIVDWKSETEQVTPYRTMGWRNITQQWDDPLDELSDFYPREAIADMRALA